MPMTKGQRRGYKKLLAERRRIRQGWVGLGRKRPGFGDWLRGIMGWDKL